MKSSEQELLYEHSVLYKEFDALCAKRHTTFEETIRFGKLYQQIIEDLSLAQTFFPNSKLCSYLNTLVISSGNKIRIKKSFTRQKLLNFFSTSLPEAIAFNHKTNIVATTIFCIIFIIGILLIQTNTEYAELFLPDNIYQQAMSDLEGNRAFSNFDGVTNRYSMSLIIWLNNVKVALITYVSGITAGFGTLIILIYNGMLIAGLSAIYFINGNFTDFISLILVHGSLELPAIFLAAASGLSIGFAIISPGRHTRAEALKKSVYMGFTLVGGIIILLLISGIIEGIITTMKPPISIRILIALFNFSWLGGYYVYSIKKLIKN